MAYNAVTVQSSATLIVPANNRRRQLILDNTGTADIFIGPDSAITTSNAPSLRAGSTLVFDANFNRGAIYGIVVTGTGTMAYWEMSE